jgi:hypothetical protein
VNAPDRLNRPAGAPAGGTSRAPLPRPAADEDQHLAAVAGELHAELAKRWPAYYPGRMEDGAPAITFTPRQCGFSAIYKVEWDFPGRPPVERAIVKIRREQKLGSFRKRDLSERTLAATRLEYDEHVKAAKFFADNQDGLSVVRPLDHIESHNALVVEFASGDDLSTLVRDGSTLASPAIRRCGAWWRLFHRELHQAQPRPWDPATVDAAVDYRLQRLRRIGAPDSFLRELRDDITRAARAVAPSPVPVSVVHGDCKLRHVWATPYGIQVLDFGNTKTGDSWLDPAALAVELSLYTLWSRRLDSAPMVGDIRTLLRAYFDGPPPPAFAFFVVDCLLKKWHRRLRKWGPGAGLTRVQRSLQTARLDKPLERLYIDRWFTTQIRAWLDLAAGRPPDWLGAVVE